MEKKYPFYFRATIILFGIVLFVYLLFMLRGILVPLAFAVMISILLNPLVTKLERKKVPKVVAIIISLLIAIAFLAGIMIFISSQIVMFSENKTVLQERFSDLFGHFQLWLQRHYSLPLAKQKEWISEAGNNLRPVLATTLGTALDTLSVIVLLPVYVFLILYYKTLILNFLYEVFAERNSKEVGFVLHQTKGAIQSYMVGLLLEAIIVAALNSIALIILGVDYALLLGVIGAILNVLPYIGGIIAIALPIIIASITKDGYSTQIGIIIAYMLIQFVDNNIIFPRIVSSKVKINALVTLVIVLLGGSLWGLAGMFLSIPIIATLKIIFDRIEELKPWGKILGTEVPIFHKGHIWKRIRSRKEALSEKVIDKTN
jgi:predicted PurR-regulated permease PerM